MIHNVVAPSVGESVTEVSILKWTKKNGQQVKSGEVILEIESDKATVEIVAEATGALSVLKPEGERLPVGTLIGTIDDSKSGTASASGGAAAGASAAGPARPVSTPAAGSGAGVTASASGGHTGTLSPAARKAAIETGVDTSKIAGTGRHGQVTKGDILGAHGGGQVGGQGGAPAGSSQSAGSTGFSGGISTGTAAATAPRAPFGTPGPTTDSGPVRRVQMSLLRAKIAERLVQAQSTAAILTTFNEVDMSRVMELRNKHKDAFKAKHGVSLGFMSFFVKASVLGLQAVPEVNAFVEGREVIYHDYVDMGVAVGTERGLVVPVVRQAQTLSFSGVEKKIAELAIRARDGKLSIADMSGGTFTISNGGVYGSLNSTPILNPPQSGILGMHKIQDRPVALDGKIVIRPMMYLALSYDHRLIDGKGAVTFLIKVKEAIENPDLLGPLE